MEQTDEEQLEALSRWWRENGRSTVLAIIIALGAGFGWRGWQQHNQQQIENASAIYQSLVQQLGTVEPTEIAPDSAAMNLAKQLQTEYDDSTYAQFAGLHLARVAVMRGELAEAQSQLRWVLARADSGGDIAELAQLRLARVLAAEGQVDQALEILDQSGGGHYPASVAAARGDILLAENRSGEAREAYTLARSLAAASGGRIDMSTLEQKIQSLSSLSPAESAGEASVEQAVQVSADSPAEPEE